MACDIFHDDFLPQEGRSAAGASLGADGQTIHGPEVSLWKTRTCSMAEVLPVRVQEQHGAKGFRNLGFNEGAEPLQYLSQGSALREEFEQMLPSGFPRFHRGHPW